MQRKRWRLWRPTTQGTWKRLLPSRIQLQLMLDLCFLISRVSIFIFLLHYNFCYSFKIRKPQRRRQEQNCLRFSACHQSVRMFMVWKKFQLSKKIEVIEKEKNDTVVRYAVREADIMRLKDEKEKYEKEVIFRFFFLLTFSSFFSFFE